MSFVIIIFLYFIATLVLKRSLVFFKKGMFIDHPLERSNHNIPTPKGAGLILIPMVIFATLLVFFLEKILFPEWLTIFGFCIILTIVSFIDDLKNLNSKTRLLIHGFCVLSSLILFTEDIRNLIESSSLFMFYNDNPYFVIIASFFALMILWIWIINLFNFMDGMDGITAVQVCFLAISINFLSILGLIEINFLYFGLILMAVFLSFYSLNKSPSKIFLGDVGSIPLGYLVGFVIIYNMIKSDLFIPFIIVIMYHLVDSTITLFIRLFNRENIFQAHSSHFYQKIIRKGFSHKYVLKRIFILNIFLLMLSFLSVELPFICLSLSVIITTVVIIFFNSRKIK
jgi:UDP-N-acetylmuramyl pentapeptide phosphotransferase/UDP-N-acetylglucosamine-1-phosphate transferase